jgi:branched-chain amino acid transport system ATP-binding protein
MNNALRLTDVTKHFGQIEIIRGVTLDVVRGECHAIIGPNGAGKSMLFNLISGRLPVTSGTIDFDGTSIVHLAPHEISRLGLSRSFQVTNIFSRLSVFENIRCAVLSTERQRYAFWKSAGRLSRVRDRTEAVVADVGLGHRRDVAASALTYAEQRALEIGITIAGNASVILLDEPTAGMSREETRSVIELVRRIGRNRTLLIIEHDMSVVFGVADRISVLVYGQVIATGTPAQIKSDPKVQEVYLGTPVHA